MQNYIVFLANKKKTINIIARERKNKNVDFHPLNRAGFYNIIIIYVIHSIEFEC